MNIISPINSYYVNTNKPVNKPVSVNTQTSFGFRKKSNLNNQPEQDCFERTSNQKQKEILNTVLSIIADKSLKPDEIYDEINKLRINKLYDRTYSTFVKDNPIISKLNYKKPKIRINKIDESCSARYGFTNNTIEVNKKGINSPYIGVIVDKKYGTIAGFELISSEKELPDIKEKYKDSDYEICAVNELNGDEEALLIATYFAHELRHSLQEHILASTKGSSDKFLNAKSKSAKKRNDFWHEVYDIYKEANFQKEEDFQESNEPMIEDGIEPPFKTLEELNAFLQDPPFEDYILNYKPKKLIENDKILKLPKTKKVPDNDMLQCIPHFAILQNSDVSWSTNNELLPGTLSYIHDCSKMEHHTNPIEIDAVAYELKFLLENADKYEDVRKEILNCFITDIAFKLFASMTNSDLPKIKKLFE